MKFTFNWLKTHLETKATPQRVADKLTAIGLEVDEFTDLGKKYAPFVIAEIKDAVKHPNADKLRVCTVNNGKEDLQIVCGAPNARVGIKVVLAEVGALIPNGNFQIKKSKIRDVESNGMLCSADELELGGDSDGIIELPQDAPLGVNYAEYAGLNDSFFEINVTPNRADALSVYGIARDLAAAGLGELKAVQDSGFRVQGSANVSIKSDSYYIGVSFKGVSNKQSPAWLKARLQSIGLAPISALVDITNFMTFDLGRPLHVYDADKLNGGLEVKTQTTESIFNALNNKSYKLGAGELVVADANGPVAIAGVIGNIESSVDENTKNILLEIAYFDPGKVAESGRRHQIDSDARYRFERGLDVELMSASIGIATRLITETCGGEVVGITETGEKPQWQREISFDFSIVKNLGGVEVANNEVQEILQKLGFKIKGDKIFPPSWRGDVEGAADLVEEVIRIYGYDKIPAAHLPYKARVEAAASLKNKDLIRQNLTSNGLTEVITYSFINPKTAEMFGFKNEPLNLQNPISSELSTMRPSILPALLETAFKSHNRGFKDLGFFEIGPVFTDGSEDVIISGIRTGKNQARNIYGDYRPIDAYDAKADLQSVLTTLNAPTGKLQRSVPPHYHPGRSGGIFLGKTPLGYFGEIHPRIVKSLGITTPVTAFEVFLKNIPPSKKKYQQLSVSDYQAVTRDFAFVVDKDLSAGDLINAVIKADKLISNAYIFDVYQGDKLEAGKKSVALSVEIQPIDKTLKDSEIEEIIKRINDLVSRDFNAKLRA